MNPHSDAIGQLYEDVGFLVHRRCLMMLKDDEEAMDVTHWTFMRAIETGFEVRSRGEALRWLYMTATQRCLTLLRNSRTRRKLREKNYEALTAGVGINAESQVLSRDLLTRAIAQVNDRTAEIALLTWGQGLSVQRAAELIKTSVRTIARERRVFEAVIAGLNAEESR